MTYTPPVPPAPFCVVCDSAAKYGMPPQDCCSPEAATRTVAALLADYCLAVAREAGDPRAH